jgi:hypothetical protein
MIRPVSSMAWSRAFKGERISRPRNSFSRNIGFVILDNVDGVSRLSGVSMGTVRRGPFQNLLGNIDRAVKDAGQNLRKTADNAGRNLRKTADNAGRNLRKTADEAGRNIRKTAETAGRNLRRTVENLPPPGKLNVDVAATASKMFAKRTLKPADNGRPPDKNPNRFARVGNRNDPYQTELTGDKVSSRNVLSEVVDNIASFRVAGGGLAFRRPILGSDKTESASYGQGPGVDTGNQKAYDGLVAKRNQASLGAPVLEGGGSYGVTLQRNRAVVAGNVGVSAGGAVRKELRTGPLFATGEGGYGASLYAQGQAGVDLSRGRQSAGSRLAGVNVGLEAFAGAKAEGSAGTRGKFGSLGVRGMALAGVGLMFRSQVGVKDGKFQFETVGGAAVLAGVGGGFSVTVDPAGTVQDVKEAGQQATQLINQASSTYGKLPNSQRAAERFNNLRI